MADSALFIGWGGTYPGRETHARQTFTEFVEALTELQAKGEIERFEPVALTSGLELDGFALIYGEFEKLMAITQLELFEQLRLKAKLDHAKLVVIPAIVGDRVVEMFDLWAQFAKELEREPALT